LFGHNLQKCEKAASGTPGGLREEWNLSSVSRPYPPTWSR